MRIRSRIGLGPHSGCACRVDGEDARRQRQGLRRPRPRRRAVLELGRDRRAGEAADIEVIGNYNGEYALGPEQAGVASLLAAHPQVDGILTQGYGTGAIKALQDAGRPIVPVTAFSYNVAATTCAQTEGAKCILGSNPAFLSSEAIRMAVDILDGKPKPADRHILVNGDFLSTDPIKSELYPEAVMQKIEIGTNAWPDRPPGLTLPITPDWVDITAEEAAGS